MRQRVYTVLCAFGGSGGCALGVQQAEQRLFDTHARFDVIGSIDVDPIACADFQRFTGAPAYCIDVRWLGVAQLVAFAGKRAPDVVIISAPCKGASRLISEAKAGEAKYRELNRLSLVFVETMLEAWGDDPPALVLLENVPGLPKRARVMLRELGRRMKSAGYVAHRGFHDCGEIGGLAQHRKRFLGMWRHPGKCAAMLYKPPKRRVRGCGEVLGELPMPATIGARAWGTLHELPRICWRNWLRLALIPAGGDHRDLPGVLADEQARREVQARHRVEAWAAPTGAIRGSGSNGVANVSDPRIETLTIRKAPRFNNNLPLVGWDEPAKSVIGATRPGSGAQSVADPRASGVFHNVDRVRTWDEPVGTITSSPAPSSGRAAVADPRWHAGAYGVTPWDEPAGAVTGGADNPSRGRFSIGDPRVDVKRAYDAGYGVLAWDAPARAIAGKVAAGCGAYAVADPRAQLVPEARVMSLDEALEIELDPEKPPPFVPLIVARDGTWHRPLTLLELAALQSYPAIMRGEPLHFGGTRTEIAEHIGNSIPPAAARATGEAWLVALMQSELETHALQMGDVWVQPTLEGATT